MHDDSISDGILPHKADSSPESGRGVALGRTNVEAMASVVDAPGSPPPVAHTLHEWPVVRWVHPSLGDWAEARSFAPERRLGTRLAVPVASACVLGGFVSGFFGWPTGLLHLLALYHLVERLLPWLLLREQRAELEGPAGLVRVTISPEELVVDRGFGGGYREPSTSRHRWRELAGYYTCPRALVLMVTSADTLLLPRVAFSEQELGLTTTVLRQELGPGRPARWRGALRPLVVSSLMLAAWALWQAQF